MESFPELDIDHGPPLWLAKFIIVILLIGGGFLLGCAVCVTVAVCGGAHHPVLYEWVGSASGLVFGLAVLYLIHREERK